MLPRYDPVIGPLSKESNHELGCLMGPQRRPTLERKHAPTIKLSASILNAVLKTPSVRQRFVSATNLAVLLSILNVYRNAFELRPGVQPF